jgi:hypothetical protein
LGKEYWREHRVNLENGVVKEFQLTGQANTVIVRNPSSSGTIKMSVDPGISTTDYEATAKLDSYGYLVRPLGGITRIFLLASADVNKVTIIESFVQGAVQLLPSMSEPPEGSVLIAGDSAGLLKTGDPVPVTQEAGEVLKVQVENTSLPKAISDPLPAGTNLIGAVIPRDTDGDEKFTAVNPAYIKVLPPVVDEQKTEANAVGGVVTFTNDIDLISIVNTDTNAGTFTINGTTVHVPAKSSFQDRIGGAAGKTVTIATATTYILTTYTL